MFVNAPYVQLDSIFWDSQSGFLSVSLKNYGNRPAQISDIRFGIAAPENNEQHFKPFPYTIVINPFRSEQVASATILNPEVIYNGKAYFIINFSYIDFRGSGQKVDIKEAYHFDFAAYGNQSKVLYARVRSAGMKEALKAMSKDLQLGPRK